MARCLLRDFKVKPVLIILILSINLRITQDSLVLDKSRDERVIMKRVHVNEIRYFMYRYILSYNVITIYKPCVIFQHENR